jgi:hypothetical protein
MDLRPKLSRDFADAVYESLADIDVLELEKGEVVDRWAEIILPLFKAHSLPLPGGQCTTENDPATIEAFLDKYPKLRPVIAWAKEIALQVFPGAGNFTLEVHSDPEGCHVCCEGQDLWLYGDYDGKKKEGEDGKMEIDYDAHFALEGQFTDLLYADDGLYEQLGDMRDLLGIDVSPYRRREDGDG